MILTHEDKLEIYQLRKKGVSWSRIRQEYKVTVSNLKYMVRLMERYGIEIVKKSKNTYYSPELKQVMIDHVLVEGRSQLSVSLDDALPHQAMLSNWLSNYKKNGDTILEKERGKPPSWGVNQRRPGKR